MRPQHGLGFLGQRWEKGVKVLKWLDDGESSQNTY
jgi:hypothetical protein